MSSLSGPLDPANPPGEFNANPEWMLPMDLILRRLRTLEQFVAWQAAWDA